MFKNDPAVFAGADLPPSNLSVFVFYRLRVRIETLCLTVLFSDPAPSPGQDQDAFQNIFSTVAVAASTSCQMSLFIRAR
jgi:hypothetical protein